MWTQKSEILFKYGTIMTSFQKLQFTCLLASICCLEVYTHLLTCADIQGIEVSELLNNNTTKFHTDLESRKNISYDGQVCSK